MYSNKLLKNICLFFLCFWSVNISSAAMENHPPVPNPDSELWQTHLVRYGEPKYQDNFSHFEYVNPDAPKQGKLKFAVIGGFDSVNPYILKGKPASGLEYLYDGLMKKSKDEEFSLYPLIAKKVAIMKDGSGVFFRLHPDAKWHDNHPITASDVVFTFNTLKSEGHPFYQSYYKEIKKAFEVSNEIVWFEFSNPNNQELPMIIAEMPILPEHYYQKTDFGKTTLTPPLASGAYFISEVNANQKISYQRKKDYWAADLAVNKGHYNFDEIEIIYYRDESVAIESLKAGDYDFRYENIARNWATAYPKNHNRDGQDLIKEELKHNLPAGMQAFVFNLRRDKFSDIRVRKALSLLFDFDWINKNLFYNSYKRTDSFFENSIFEAPKYEITPQEKEILQKYQDKLPKEALEIHKPSGKFHLRRNIRQALGLLKQAGWNVDNGKMIDSNGNIFEIEFLIRSRSFERVIAAYRKNLERIGIKVSINYVDSAEYQRLIDRFDYDIIVNVFAQSNSPGNEQISYWHSSQVNNNGSRNYSGIANEGVDNLISKIVNAATKDELILACRALDRALLSLHIVVPNWYVDSFRIVYWNKIARPKIMPKYDLAFPDIWWHK